MATIEVKTKLLEHSRKYVKDAPKAFGKVFTTTAWVIIGKAIPITPMKDGHLRDSNFVEEPEINNHQVVVNFGFGGVASRYAWRVHELPERSNWTTPGTGPKYLEKPFREELPKLGRSWSASMTQQMSGTFGS